VSRRKHHYNSSHRDRASPLHRTVSSDSPASSFSLAVCRRVALPDLIDARICDRPWALVCKPSECKRLAHFEDFVSVHLVLEQRVACCICRRSVRRSKWLRWKSHISYLRLPLCTLKPVLKGTRLTSAGISSSKCRVSSGLRSCGLKGASVRWILSQSIPLNHTCACGWWTIRGILAVVIATRRGRPQHRTDRSRCVQSTHNVFQGSTTPEHRWLWSWW